MRVACGKAAWGNPRDPWAFFSSPESHNEMEIVVVCAAVFFFFRTPSFLCLPVSDVFVSEGFPAKGLTPKRVVFSASLPGFSVSFCLRLSTSSRAAQRSQASATGRGVTSREWRADTPAKQIPSVTCKDWDGCLPSWEGSRRGAHKPCCRVCLQVSYVTVLVHCSSPLNHLSGTGH